MEAWAFEAAGVVGHAFFAAFASIEASIVVAFLSVAALIRNGFHRTKDGRINAKRIGLVAGKSLAIYSFAVCIIFNYLFRIPVSKVISDGFGNDRFALIFFVLLLEQGSLIWDEYRSGHE